MFSLTSSRVHLSISTLFSLGGSGIGSGIGSGVAIGVGASSKMERAG